MERLKTFSSSFFIAKDKVSVSAFIETWTHELTDEVEIINCKDLILKNSSDLNIPKKIIQRLENEINLDNYFNTITDESKKLVEGLPETNSEMRTDMEGVCGRHAFKYRHELIDKPANGFELHTCPVEHVNPLAVLTVQLFKPAIKNRLRYKLNLDQEFQVLSCQTLSVLRDSFICVYDVMTNHDYSLNPQETLPTFTGHESCGFFLIDNTFYYDQRNEHQSIEKIEKWLLLKVGRFEKKSMQETRFDELTIRLGFPYLYMHRGNCEHLLVFTDMRILLPNLTPDMSCFPKCTATAKLHRVKCQMCQMYCAKWVTLNNKRLPHSPYYFCHSCFISFNYDCKFNKIGSFEAFPLFFNLTPIQQTDN